MSLFVSLDQNTFPDLMEMALANITGGIGTFGDLPVRAQAPFIRQIVYIGILVTRSS
jgi:hypothetical protein